MRKKDIPITIVNIKKPSKAEAKQRIELLNQYLSNNWYTPLEKQSNK